MSDTNPFVTESFLKLWEAVYDEIVERKEPIAEVAKRHEISISDAQRMVELRASVSVIEERIPMVNTINYDNRIKGQSCPNQVGAFGCKLRMRSKLDGQLLWGKEKKGEIFISHFSDFRPPDCPKDLVLCCAFCMVEKCKAMCPVITGE